MKRNFMLVIPVCVYEFFRCFTILTTRPEHFIDMLPLSWYAGVFSLILPAILAYYAFSREANRYSWYYLFIKAAQDIGICKYMSDDWSYAIENGFYNNWYSINRIISLVSFLVIDVILIFILFIYQKKRKDSNADNSSSEW